MLIKTVCEEGEIHERIVDLADAENCDIIVMGRRGLTPVERIARGRGDGPGDRPYPAGRACGAQRHDVGWKTIVVATDGSRYSAAAADRAIAFAKSYGGELMVVSVVDVPTEFYAEAPQAVEDLVRKAKGYVADVKKQAEAAGVKAETYVGEAEAYEAINNLAREQKADMIVLGSHGRTGLRRLLMGSVTEKVIGYAPCPVLVVKS